MSFLFMMLAAVYVISVIVCMGVGAILLAEDDPDGLMLIACAPLWPLYVLWVRTGDLSRAERKLNREIARARRETRLIEKRKELEREQARARTALDSYLSEEVL